MTIPELIEVLRAAELGKAIEARSKGFDEWRTVSGISMGHLALYLSNGVTLRVKPEPREGWVPEELIFKTVTEASRCGWGRCKLIHVKEVVP